MYRIRRYIAIFFFCFVFLLLLLLLLQTAFRIKARKPSLSCKYICFHVISFVRNWIRWLCNFGITMYANFENVTKVAHSYVNEFRKRNRLIRVVREYGAAYTSRIFHYRPSYWSWWAASWWWGITKCGCIDLWWLMLCRIQISGRTTAYDVGIKKKKKGHIATVWILSRATKHLYLRLC